VIIAGTGWMLHNLRPLLFPDFTINFIFIAIAGMGELALMLWLLIRGCSSRGHLRVGQRSTTTNPTIISRFSFVV
jgi:hypothetical protein